MQARGEAVCAFAERPAARALARSAHARTRTWAEFNAGGAAASISVHPRDLGSDCAAGLAGRCVCVCVCACAFRVECWGWASLLWPCRKKKASARVARRGELINISRATADAPPAQSGWGTAMLPQRTSRPSRASTARTAVTALHRLCEPMGPDGNSGGARAGAPTSQPEAPPDVVAAPFRRPADVRRPRRRSQAASEEGSAPAPEAEARSKPARAPRNRTRKRWSGAAREAVGQRIDAQPPELTGPSELEHFVLRAHVLGAPRAPSRNNSEMRLDTRPHWREHWLLQKTSGGREQCVPPEDRFC